MRGREAARHMYLLFLQAKRTQPFSHLKEGKDAQEDTGVKA